MGDTLDMLRRRIQEIEGRPATARRLVDCGLPALDAEAGGLPCPGLVAVEGPAGSGRTRLVLSWVAARTRRGERVAWVDPGRLLHPPAAAALGVTLDRLLLVRPDEAHSAWSVEQVLRSGCFGIVVLGEPLPDLLAAGPRWLQAARYGSSTLVVLTSRSERALALDLRLVLRDGVVTVLRRRGGSGGRRVALPAWPEELDPWA